MASRILLVDQEEKFVQTLAKRLEAAGFPVQVMMDADEALVSIESIEVEVLIFGDPDDGGAFLGLLGEVKRFQPELAIILLTPHVSSDYAIKAMKMGIYDCLPKPTNIGDLINRLREIETGKPS